MSQPLLLIHLAQAEQSLERAKNNAYSDKTKEEYQDTLFDLFLKVKADVENTITTLSPTAIYGGPKRHLDFIFKSLQFLDSSTLNQIPYEIVECLDYAMRENIDPSDKYIIVTSLINDANSFSYEGWLAFDDTLYADIKTKYGIEFTHRLIQINLPKALARDYIAAVVLYHELGHFIDYRYSLMLSLTYHVFSLVDSSGFTALELNELQKYFPYLSSYIAANPKPVLGSGEQSFDKINSHFSEYFCDLFAAQYIGNSLSEFITYLTENDSQEYDSHPSTTNRVKVVADYISNSPNIIVTLVNQALSSIRGFALQKRHTAVSLNDFFNLVPTVIKTPQELHGLINAGWDIWFNHKTKLAHQLNTSVNSKIYSVINNLIEKSIGNYITEKNWQKGVKKLGL